ncbi:MAG: DUF5686 family protein [Saprospiraceae bacterium]
MDFHIVKKYLLFFLFSCCLSAALYSQKMTIVKGTVIDAQTKEPLLLVNIAFLGTAIGTSTDLDGSFVLESKWASDSVQISYLGYDTQTLPIVLGSRQELNVALSPSSINMATVEVTAKRGRYKRKGNPAVELMRNVIDHKNDNRLEALDFYEYHKYEKVQFDFNNFDPEKLSKKKVFKKFKFMLDYVDTSELNGKPYLPFFIQETSSKVYYRKDPESTKEYREGVKVTGMDEYVDNEDLTTMTEFLYQKINIYDDNVRLLDLPFMSPLSPLAITYYRFYITDTMAMVNDIPVIKVSFMPVNNQNIAFRGDLFITKDSSYAVIKADLGLTRQANVNFVQDLKLIQEFSNMSGVWALSKDKIVIDFAVLKKGLGIYGTREVTYFDHILNKPKDDSIYAGTENVIENDDTYKKDDTFWLAARPDTLTKEEQGIYEMIDTLQKVPTFRTLVDIGALLFTGYKAFGPVDIGPIGNFYSFNPVEGFRLKAGGETNLKFHPKINFGGYGAYGFKDKEFKYGIFAQYSFREDYKTNPKHYLKFSYQHDVSLVGLNLPFTSSDNFLLSIQRGTRDKYLFLDKYIGEYFLEGRNNLSWLFNYTNTRQRPIGGLVLNYDEITKEGDTITNSKPNLTTSEIAAQIRFAPNEQYVQGRNYRVPIFNRYPVFTLKLAAGVNGFLGGDQNYQKVSLGIFKRFYLSLFGTMKVDTEFGKIWGNGVPYFLLYLPIANQSYAYRSGAFNMMNYQEFVADEYGLIMIEHFLNGFIFNKIPLFRKLKLREVITYKMIYGRLTDRNNPNKTLGLIKFVEEGDPGQERPITYTLEDKPYIEGSVGISNIFKIIRIDLLRRFTHLDHPEVPYLFGVKGLGIRVKASFEF